VAILKIEVTFDIDANGILNVSAKDKATSKQHQMRIQTSGGLSKTEIENMKKQAEQMSKEDKKKREAVELKNAADALIWQAESQLEEYKDKIDEELKTEITSGISTLRDLRGQADVDSEKLKTASDDLRKKLMKIGEKIYNTANQNPNSQSTGQPNDQSSSENTQDAETKDKPK